MKVNIKPVIDKNNLDLDNLLSELKKPEKYKYLGKDIEKMSKDELKVAVIHLGKLYNSELDRR